MSHRIRELTEVDLPQLSVWESLCFPTEPWSEKMLLSHLEFHRGFVLEADAAMSYALVCETPWEVEIFRISTLPNWRQKGLAKQLLSELFNVFGTKDFFLELREDNLPALNLYLSLGFFELERRNKYYPDGSTAILMKKEKL